MQRSAWSTALVDDIATFERAVRPALESANSMEAAAQIMARELFDSFEAGVLVRLYQTMRYHQLPPPARQFVRDLAEKRDVADRLHGMSPVLALLGTWGSEPDWRDRRKSRGHVAIPLFDASFVQSIPMVARLLQDLGVGMDFFDPEPGVQTWKLLGGVNGVFYVPEAATASDHLGRRIIPAQDFVAAHGVKTVFGMGGAYLAGSMVCAIVFAAEFVPRAQAERFARTISIFKAATLRLARQNRFFEAEPAS